MKNNSVFLGNRVLITGGSSGIGLAIAKEFAALGAKVCVVARDVVKLSKAREEIQGLYPDATVLMYHADVTSIQSLDRIKAGLEKEWGSLDTLVCSAGLILCGRFEDQPLEETEYVFDTNYWGTHYAIRSFLPLLKESSIGRVVIISSVVGFTGLFGYSHYAPSKFAVAGLAETLRMEFADYGIKVLVAYPPDTQTPQLEFEKSNTLPESIALSGGSKVLSAEYVAQKILAGICRNKFDILFNSQSLQIRIVKGLLPKLYYSIVDKIVRKSRLS